MKNIIIRRKLFDDMTVKIIKYFSFINFDELKLPLTTRLQAIQPPKLGN